MKQFLRRVIYGRRYSLPSDALLQDGVLFKVHQEVIVPDASRIFADRLAGYGSPELLITFKDNISQEKYEEIRNKFKDPQFKLNGQVLPKGVDVQVLR